MSGKILTIIFFLVSAVVLFWNLDGGSLLNSDDAIYAAMARDAWRSGDYMSFRYLGRVVYEKPPLLFWMLSACFEFLRPCDLAARIPDALCALALLATVTMITVGGSRGINSRKGDPRVNDWGTGFLAAPAFLLATSLFYFNARRVMTDVPFWLFSFLFMMMLACPGAQNAGVYKDEAVDPKTRKGARPGNEQDRPMRGSAVTAGVFAGLAVMTKGMAFVPVAAGAGIWFVLTRGWRTWGWKHAGLFVLAFHAVAGWWHGYQIWTHGWDFVRSYLGYHAVSRITQGLITRTEPMFYARRLLDLEGSVWTIVLVGGIAAALAVALARRRSIDIMLASFTCVYLPLILLMQTRLEHYLLPLLVVSAVYQGRGVQFLESFMALKLRGRVQHNRLIAATGIVGGALAVCGIFFAAHNGFHMMSGEYSRGYKILTQEAARLGRPIIAFNDYNVITHWYADHPVYAWSTDSRLCSILESTDMLRRSHYYWCPETENDLVKEIVRTRPILLARTSGAEEVKKLLARRGIPLPRIVAREGELVLLD